MKRVNNKTVQRGKIIRDIIHAKSSEQTTRAIDGQIQDVISSAPRFTAQEIKEAVDEIDGIISKEENARLSKIRDGLFAIYDRVKDYKILPVDGLNKPFLEALGDGEESDPEGVKTLREKSIKVKESIEQKQKLRKAKEKHFIY